jgi:hypothetical protein
LAAVVVAVPGWAAEATYLLTGGQRPAHVLSNGYVQTVSAVADGRHRVRVSVAHDPIGATGGWRSVDPLEVPSAPAGFRIPGGLRAALSGEVDAWSAATTVLAWVADHVVVDAEDPRPQDATSVLRRGRGRCSGLANAATALLRSAGFEARTVSGLLVDDRGVTPHRWIECNLPGAGWVPSDPTLGLWIVTPSHITFADAVIARPEVTVERSDPPAWSRLPRLDGRAVRPNRGAGLICRLGDGGAAVATLRDGFGDVRRAVLDPEGRFDRLLPGDWRLEVERSGRVIAVAELKLAAGRLHHFTVDTELPGGGS